MMSLQNRVCLVFGGASGIGRAAAETLAARRAAVVIADVNEEQGTAVAESIIERNSRAVFVRADVLDDDSVEAAVKQAEQEFGRVDVVVNSAGRILREGEPNAFEKNIEMLLMGTWRGVKYGIEALRRAGGGSIVNISSIAGVRAAAVSPPGYTEAKHGVVGMSRQAALNHTGDNIRVNSICPGHFPTGMNTRNQAEDGGEHFIKEVIRVPLGRFGKLDEIGTAIAFLASDESSYITGQEIVVDGGITAH